jgi:hypothetical protein
MAGRVEQDEVAGRDHLPDDLGAQPQVGLLFIAAATYDVSNLDRRFSAFQDLLDWLN